MFTLNFHRVGKERGLGRRFGPTLVFFPSLPSNLMVTAPVPAVFSLFEQLVNHPRGGVRRSEQAGLCFLLRNSLDILHLHSGRVDMFFRTIPSMVPGEVEVQSQDFIRIFLPGAKWVTVEQGQAFNFIDASCTAESLILLGTLTGPLAGQGVTRMQATFEKAPKPKQAGKGSMEEQPWEESLRSTSLFLMGSSVSLA